MRRISVLVLAVMFVFVGVAVANDEGINTGYTDRGNYTTPSPSITKWLNENKYIHHNHKIDLDVTTPFGAGAGLDLVLYKAKEASLLDEVFVEGRYDIVNNETRIYGVARIRFDTFYAR